MKKRTCGNCKKTFPATFEFFHKKAKNKDGSYMLQVNCKKCSNIMSRKYYKENRVKCLENKKDYYKRNESKIIKYRKKYREKNLEKIKAKSREYYKENRAKCLKNKKEYNKKNREERTALNAKRRANKYNATPKWSEKSKIRKLYKKAKWLSKLTGLTYHVDHVIPLQGKNVCGLHVWNNLQILEESLNCKKGNKLCTNF